ncbi:MAG TPA: hypothetical protein VIY48_17535 [Candidatus Paceibacterota bacterium]
MSDEPTIGEVIRRLSDFREDVAKDLKHVFDEIRALRAELVRKDVYDANRITDQQRFFSIEAQLKDVVDERKGFRRLVYGSVGTAIATLLATIISYFLTHH